MAEPPPPSGSLDLVDLLVADHRVVEGLFAEIEVAAGDPNRRRRTLDVVIAQLMRHGAVEKEYLVPATRQYLAAGKELATHELTERAEIDEIVDQLISLDATEPDFDPLVAELITGVRHHVHEQETELFPRLRMACDVDTLQKLGTEARARHAPPHSRP